MSRPIRRTASLTLALAGAVSLAGCADAEPGRTPDRDHTRPVVISVSANSPEQLIQIADMDIAQAIVDPNSLAVGIITTQGRTLEFTVPPLVRSTSTGTEWQLDQSLDVADFLEFMRIFESELA